ncbi:hypothetical protein Agub_g12520, partial [Astrephomene gubernaculifera]
MKDSETPGDVAQSAPSTWPLASSLESSNNVVRTSTEFVASQAVHVQIDQKAINKAVDEFSLDKLKELTSPKAFNKDIHFVDGGPLTVQYLLVVDALNFCFWPDEELEYEQLSVGIKRALESDPTALSAERLLRATGADVAALLGWGREVPLQEERA